MKKRKMKLGFKILIGIIVVITLVLLDNLQAYLFNNVPIISYKEKVDDYWYQKRSILVTTNVYCGFIKEVTLNFRSYIRPRVHFGCEGVDTTEYLLKPYISDLASLDIDSKEEYRTHKIYQEFLHFKAAAPAILNVYLHNEFSAKEAFVSAILLEDITPCNFSSWESIDEFYKDYQESTCVQKFIEKIPWKHMNSVPKIYE